MDYKYNEKDVAMMRVALKDFQEDSSRAMFYSVAIMGLSAVFLRKRQGRSLELSGLAGFLAGSLSYQLYTQPTRNYYNQLACIVNSNASEELNTIMKY